MSHFFKILLIPLLLHGCALLPARRPASEGAGASVPVHYVVLIHGIGGNASHFGHLEEALMKHLPAENPQIRWEVLPFEYDTGHPERTTIDFAKDLGRFLAGHFEKHPGTLSDDRISLVMHSQGGIVGALWMFHAFDGETEFHPEFAPRIDAFISIGTPWWGAKTATFAGILGKPGASLGRSLHMGVRELEELSFGSDTITHLRRRATSPEHQATWMRIHSQIRPLNIGGVVKYMRFAAPLAAGAHQYEDDTAVPLPSSHFDFLHAESLDTTFEGGEEIAEDKFGEVSFAPFVAVQALHLSPAPEHLNGMVQIPARCTEDAECDHPTWPLIFPHLLGRELPKTVAPLSGMTAFQLDIGVHLPAGHGLKPSDLKLRFKKTSGKKKSRTSPKIKVGDPFELFSKGISRAAKSENEFRYFQFGTCEMPGNDGVCRGTLSFTVSAPGFRTRTVHARIRAAQSTWLEISLQPNDGN